MPKAASSTASANSSTRSRAASAPAISFPKSASIAAGCILRSIAPCGSGSDRIASSTNHLCVGVEQDESGARLLFKETTAGSALPPVEADIVIACDGVNSALRKQLVGDSVVFTGINTWRGVTRHKPILTGRSYLRIGSILTGKIVIYPIADNIDGAGQPAHQLDHRDSSATRPR